MPQNMIPPLYECPEINHINRLPMRAELIPFDTIKSALAFNPQKSPWYQCLDGTWKFKRYANPELVPDAALKNTPTPAGFKNIKVPGNWTLQGWDAPHYTNITMPFKDNPPLVPAQNPTGIYKTEFTLAKAWQGRRVVLHFGGAESCIFVYCNGSFVGMSKDSRLAAEFDLTPFLVKGKNRLTVKCVKFSDASYVEDQDHWWMAGIFRSVYLFSTERAWLEDIFAKSTLINKYSDGAFELNARLGVSCEPDTDYEIRVQLYGANNKPLFAKPLTSLISRSFRKGYYQGNVSAVLPKVLPWSAEVPNLYTVVVSLHKSGGRLVECAALKTGFRTYELKNALFLVNGQAVKIKGANHHDHDPDHGKSVDKKWLVKDMELLKRNNFNAVRTSHYPKDSVFYDLCDEYGLYVICEANLENHSNYETLCHNYRWQEAYFERITRMVRRFKNRACIYAWSLCNESGHGYNHNRAAEWIRAYDDTRLLHNEGIVKTGWSQYMANDYGPGGEISSDFIPPMYPTPMEVENWATSKSPKNRPFIMCEYDSITGNSCGCLKEYWDIIYKYNRVQGGYLWQWLDQGIRRLDKNGKMYWAYGGDFGDEPNDRNFMCNGLVNADRVPHPALAECHKVQQPLEVMVKALNKGQFIIKNRDYFRTASWLTGSWAITINGESKLTGTITGLKTPPLGSQLITIQEVAGLCELPPNILGSEVHILFSFITAQDTLWAKAGHEAAWDQFDLTSLIKPLPKAAYKVQKAECRLEKQADIITLTSETSRMVVNKKLGILCSFSNGPYKLPGSGPQFNIWRGLIDNDGIHAPDTDMKKMDKMSGTWYRAGLNKLRLTKTKTVVLKDNSGVEITERFQPAAKPQAGFIHKHQYTISSQGTLLCRHEFLVEKGLPDLPRVGIRLQLPGSLEQLTWFGRGPHESYPDRKFGARLGVFCGLVKDQHHGYTVPQENGLKQDVRYFRLCDKQGKGVEFRCKQPLAFSANYYTPEDLDNAYHINELKTRPEITVLMDAAHRGVGSAGCGPDTMDCYKVFPGKYVLEYEVIAV